MNLILDDTASSEKATETGNGVGKTTVLKMVDFALGGKKKDAFTDDSTNKANSKVKLFLEQHRVSIRLTLVEDFSPSSKTVVIERSFSPNKNCEFLINNQAFNRIFGLKKIQEILFPNLLGPKPTFREIVPRNIRYKNYATASPVLYDGPFISNLDYETLYFYLLGCKTNSDKKEIKKALLEEQKYFDRLQAECSLADYLNQKKESEIKIQQLTLERSSMGINPNFRVEVARLDEVSKTLNDLLDKASSLARRISLIESYRREMESEKGNVDVSQIRALYQEVTDLTINVQHNFEDLVAFHQSMAENKSRFVESELPDLRKEKSVVDGQIASLREEELRLKGSVTRSSAYDVIMKLSDEISQASFNKGVADDAIKKIGDSQKKIGDYSRDLDDADKALYSNDNLKALNSNLAILNLKFSAISQLLYNEAYNVEWIQKVDEKTQKSYYFFQTNSLNSGEGKNQGETLAFDIAYTLFAREQKIPHLDFLMTDRKELMADNQLNTAADIVAKNNIQMIIPMLSDKIPAGFDKKSYVALRLSQGDKLLKIESVNP